MNEKEQRPLSEEEYLDFVRRRVETTEFHAEEKLKRIDDLADVIFFARKSRKPAVEK